MFGRVRYRQNVAMPPRKRAKSARAVVIVKGNVVHAMVLRSSGTPLEYTELATPVPGPGQIGVKVHACGVCRTDLHVVDGELPHARSPVIPGHEIIGRV